jgi:hypothetical protein
MYAFYSLLIYIFYSLFRRDGGAAAATADPRDPAQVSRVGLYSQWIPAPTPRSGGGSPALLTAFGRWRLGAGSFRGLQSRNWYWKHRLQPHPLDPVSGGKEPHRLPAPSSGAPLFSP